MKYRFAESIASVHGSSSSEGIVGYVKKLLQISSSYRGYQLDVLVRLDSIRRRLQKLYNVVLFGIVNVGSSHVRHLLDRDRIEQRDVPFLQACLPILGR